jgi:iron-sulfur cluster assembly protein
MTKQLITISDNAAKRIKEILSNAESGVKGVRVSVKSGGCAGMEYEMTYLKETIPNDEVVKDNNVEVFIDPKAIMYLLGTKMDYKEDKFHHLLCLTILMKLNVVVVANRLKFKLFS